MTFWSSPFSLSFDVVLVVVLVKVVVVILVIPGLGERFNGWEKKNVGENTGWLVVEPTHLKNMLVKWEIFPK